MKITQISVFLENRRGRLNDVCALLGKNGINIRALTIAETESFGVLRIVVDKPGLAFETLKENDFTANITDVVAVEVSDEPGGLSKVLKVLSDNDVNIEYMYGFVEKFSDNALLVFRFEDTEKAVKTLALLFRRRPEIIFVQSPPSFAVFFVYLYCVLAGNGRFVVDAHSDAMQSPYWTRPRWLYRFLARQAVTTIVTNEHFQQQINNWGGHAFVLRDIPTTFPKAGSYPVNGKFSVTVVNTFAADVHGYLLSGSRMARPATGAPVAAAAGTAPLKK